MSKTTRMVTAALSTPLAIVALLVQAGAWVDAPEDITTDIKNLWGNARG